MPAPPEMRALSSVAHLQRVLDPLRLRLLVEVGVRGSISAAAKALDLGQPSASLHLRTLESVVGHRLVERGTRASRLTAAGEIVAEAAARVLTELQAMDDELTAYGSRCSGSLSVAVCTSVSYLLPRALRIFSESCPDVEVSVRVAKSARVDRMVALREVDLGIGGETARAEDVDREPLLEDEVTGISAPGLLELRAGVLAPRRLAETVLLVLQPGSSQRTAADHALEDLDAHPGRTRLLDSQEAVKRAVRDGIGVAFVSRLTVREEIDRGELVAFRLRDQTPIAHPLHLILHPEQRAALHHREFSHALRSAWRAGAGEEPAARL